MGVHTNAEQESRLQEAIDCFVEGGASGTDVAYSLLSVLEHVVAKALGVEKDAVPVETRAEMREAFTNWMREGWFDACTECGKELDVTQTFGKTIGCHGCDAVLCSDECARKHVQKDGHAA